MAIGSAIGGTLGGIIGAIPTFGIGTGAGAAAGAALGGAIEGGVKWSQANKQTIDPTDIRQQQLLNEIIRKRKMLESGAMYSPQQEAISQMGLSAMNRAQRASGGNIGATMQAFAQAQRGTGRALNELYGNMMGQSVNMMGMQGQLTQEMANRILGLQMYNKQQAMVHGANTLQGGVENLLALAASKGTSVDNAIGAMKKRRTASEVLGIGGGADGGAGTGMGFESLLPYIQMQNPTQYMTTGVQQAPVV
jgi:hypothetical protein